jgi:hypothetical protein
VAQVYNVASTGQIIPLMVAVATPCYLVWNTWVKVSDISFTDNVIEEL